MNFNSKHTLNHPIFSSLLQLRERMGLWHTDESYQRIGDVIVKFSPFFKMYTEYVKNFDNAIHTINTLYAKNSKFAGIMDEIHVSIISCLFTKWWIGRAKVFRKPFCERVLMANSWLPPFRNFLWVFWLILPKLTHTLDFFFCKTLENCKEKFCAK